MNPNTRILLLLTESAAARITKSLDGLGYQTQTCSLLSIEHLPLQAEQERVLAMLDCFDDLIVTSAYAGNRLVDLAMKRYPQGLRAHCYAIGPVSADSLSELARIVHLPEQDFRTEGLLDLPNLSQPTGRKILLVQGEGARPKLANTLTRRGACVDSLILYRKIANETAEKQLPALIKSSWDAILVGSIETLRALAKIIPPESLSPPLLVPSQRVQKTALGLGFESAVVLGSVSAETLIEYFNRGRNQNF